MSKSTGRSTARKKSTSLKKKRPELKTDLFVRIQDLKGIDQQLEKVMLMPRHKRLQWSIDHELMLTSLLDTFVEDSMMVVDGFEFDSQTIDLSVEYVGSLKNVMYKVRSILYEQDQLQS